MVAPSRCGPVGRLKGPGRALAAVVRHRDDCGERADGTDTPAYAGYLHARDYDRWLDREETERLPLDLLRPFESEAMEMYAANPKVGNVRNNGPELMRVTFKAAESGELPL